MAQFIQKLASLCCKTNLPNQASIGIACCRRACSLPALAAAWACLAATATLVAALRSKMPPHQAYALPADGRFSLAQRVWRLTEAEQFGWARRFDRLLAAHNPQLPGVDGDRLAIERRHQQPRWQPAAARFARQRQPRCPRWCAARRPRCNGRCTSVARPPPGARYWPPCWRMTMNTGWTCPGACSITAPPLEPPRRQAPDRRRPHGHGHGHGHCAATATATAEGACP